MAEHERCIDDESFKLDHDPLDPAATMCAESYALASTSAAKEALVRLPESRRNVLVCIDQIKPGSPPETEQARRGEVTVVEFASIIAKMALEERRQMLNEMEEMRMFHFDSSILLYQALIRRNPEKFGSKKTGGTSMSVGGPKPVQPYQQAPTAYNTGPNPNQGNIAASAYHGLLFTQPPPPPVARDPRLPPAPQDPRRDYRR